MVKGVIKIKRTQDSEQVIVEKENQRPVVYSDLIGLVINEFGYSELKEAYNSASEIELEIDIKIKSSK